MKNYQSLLTPPVAFLVATLFLLSSLAGSAHATEAAASALLDNPMHDNSTDVIEFPGSLSRYTNRVFLTVEPDFSGGVRGTNGNAGIFWGEDIAFGLWIHRTQNFPDLENTLMDTNAESVVDDLVLTDFTLPDTHNVMDFIMGFNNGFGFRLSLAVGLDATDDENPEEEDEIVTTGGLTVGMDAMLGYSLDKTNYRGDFGLGVRFFHFNYMVDGRSMYKSKMIPSILFRHRSIVNHRKPIGVVFDANIALSNHTVTIANVDEDEDSFTAKVHDLNAQLVIGPRFQIPKTVSVNVGLKLGITRGWGEVAEPNTLDTRSTFLLPGAIASAEFNPIGTFVVRGATDYGIILNKVDQPSWQTDDDGDPEFSHEVTSKRITQQFAWSLGMGIAPGDFRLDATVRQAFVFNGSQTLGGNDPGFLGMITGAYLW